MLPDTLVTSQSARPSQVIFIFCWQRLALSLTPPSRSSQISSKTGGGGRGWGHIYSETPALQELLKFIFLLNFIRLESFVELITMLDDVRHYFIEPIKTNSYKEVQSSLHSVPCLAWRHHNDNHHDKGNVSVNSSPSPSLLVLLGIHSFLKD